MASILIVEDEKDIVLLLDIYLTLRGHTIIEKAYDGEMGIHYFRQNYQHIDFVLLDYRMPRKNGLEVAKEMLMINIDTKIIFLTADYSIRAKTEKLRIVGFITKPISLDLLNDLIEKNLEEKVEKSLYIS